MNKLTDSEIVKAFKICYLDEGECSDCPLCDEDMECTDTGDSKLLTEVGLLLDRQKVENERLLQKLQHPVVAENAITALREKCVEKQEFLIGDDNRYKGYVSIEDLDYIIEESGVRNY